MKLTNKMWADPQLSYEQAKVLHDSKEWEQWTFEQIFKFQLFQERLCIPFEKFHEASEKTLGRPVFTHEFGFRDELVKEYLGDKPAPSFDDIIGLLPRDKVILITNVK